MDSIVNDTIEHDNHNDSIHHIKVLLTDIHVIENTTLNGALKEDSLNLNIDSNNITSNSNNFEDIGPDKLKDDLNHLEDNCVNEGKLKDVKDDLSRVENVNILEDKLKDVDNDLNSVIEKSGFENNCSNFNYNVKTTQGSGGSDDNVNNTNNHVDSTHAIVMFQDRLQNVENNESIEGNIICEASINNTKNNLNSTEDNISDWNCSKIKTNLIQSDNVSEDNLKSNEINTNNISKIGDCSKISNKVGNNITDDSVSDGVLNNTETNLNCVTNIRVLEDSSNNSENDKNIILNSSCSDDKILSNTPNVLKESFIDSHENKIIDCETPEIVKKDSDKNDIKRLEFSNQQLPTYICNKILFSSTDENIVLKPRTCVQSLKKSSDAFSLNIFDSSSSQPNKSCTLEKNTDTLNGIVNSELKCPFINNSLFHANSEISKNNDCVLNLTNSCVINGGVHITPDLHIYSDIWKNQESNKAVSLEDSKIANYKEPIGNNFPSFNVSDGTKDIFEFGPDVLNSTTAVQHCNQIDLSCNFLPVIDGNKNNLLDQQFINCVTTENSFVDFSFETKHYNGLVSEGSITCDQSLNKQIFMGSTISSIISPEKSLPALVHGHITTDSRSFSRKVDETLLGECPPDGSDSGLGCELADDRLVLQTDSLSSDELSTPVTSEGTNWAVRTTTVSHGFDLVKPSSSSSLHCQTKSNLKRLHSSVKTCEPPLKRIKKSISFDNVSVFYFPRVQGFTCVPSQVSIVIIFTFF